MEVNGEEPTKVEHVQSGDQNHKSLVHHPSKKHLSGRKNVKFHLMMKKGTEEPKKCQDKQIEHQYKLK